MQSLRLPAKLFSPKISIFTYMISAIRSRFSAFRYAGALAVCALLVTASCRYKEKVLVVTPEPSTPLYGSLTVKFSNEAGGTPIVMGSGTYTNAAGNAYKVDLLKYFVSNFTLIKSDNSEHNFANYKLINAADTSTCSFTLDSVANGTYKAVRFYIGVDSAKNHTLLNEGDLNASNGMTWTWSTGYIFFKHEGTFINDTGGTSVLLYHYGVDANMKTIDIPVSAFTIAADHKTMLLKFDLNKQYGDPNVITFDSGNAVHQSLETRDRAWLGQMKANFSSAFTFDKVQ